MTAKNTLIKFTLQNDLAAAHNHAVECTVQTINNFIKNNDPDEGRCHHDLFFKGESPIIDYFYDNEIGRYNERFDALHLHIRDILPNNHPCHNTRNSDIHRICLRAFGRVINEIYDVQFFVL